MVDAVKKILSLDIQTIIGSELSLLLLKTYSTLYLNGGQPRSCERSQRAYYSQLKKDGMNKAELIEKVKQRTCVPNWEGLKYSTITMKHYSNLLIFDENAIDGLERGALKESDFKVLPEGYGKQKELSEDEALEKEIKLEELNEILKEAIETGNKKQATKIKKAITRLSNK